MFVAGINCVCIYIVFVLFVFVWWTLLGILFLTRFSFSRIYSTTEACCGDGNLVDSCQGDKDHHRGNNGFIDIENHCMDYFLLFDREIMKRKS